MLLLMHFGLLNYIVLSVYLAGMLTIGALFAKRQKTKEDYFLAGRRMPWLPVAMSMFASLTSAITFMAVPSAAYHENIAMVVVCVISPLLAPLLVFVVYPVYRRLHVTTSYEYIGHRFGVAARCAVSALFVLARLGWMGTVIYAPALALTVATGVSLPLSLLLMGIMATLYTVMGGLAAVLWTDVAQFLILVGGAVWVAIALVADVPGGVAGIFEVARDAGRLQIVSWKLSLMEMSGLVVAVSFFLQMLQDYGTDQVTVQRMLSVRTRGGVMKATFFNAFTDTFMIALLLFIGLGLFAFYRNNTGELAGLPGDSILPHYVMSQLPAGVSGLVISAIFAAAMSSIDSGLNSLATVIDNDFITPFSARQPDEAGAVVRARFLTLVLGLLATCLAFSVMYVGHIIKSFAMFMSLFNAPVLALFVLGFVSRRSRFGGWLVGLAVGLPATLWLQHIVKVHWVYYFPFSFAATFAVGWLASLLLPGALPAWRLTIPDKR